MSDIPAPSSEEKDALDRSRKNVRLREGSFSAEQTLVERNEVWMHDVEDGNELKS